MFTRIQAHHFRCLKLIDQPLGRFEALVGPNASGKTTFLDVLVLLSDLMRSRGNAHEAVAHRSADFSKLLWKAEGSSFQVAVEAAIPGEILGSLLGSDQLFQKVRYELEIGLDEKSNEIGLNHERLWLTSATDEPSPTTGPLFPDSKLEEPSILWEEGSDRRISIAKSEKDFDYYYPDNRKLSQVTFRLKRSRSALANIPLDDERFPIGNWFREMLETGVQNVILDSQKIRQPSPPGLGLSFQTDGSNLPWVIDELSKNKKKFTLWLEHLRTALEDIVDIRVLERENDRQRYLVIDYANGVSVPSWLVSDGTLRLLALTIPAYIEKFEGTYVIEEPENGIHPRALETVIQSLTSIYDGQVLLATHSPIVIAQLEPQQILCFAKDSSGATDIVSGDHHPNLLEWKRGKPDLGILFASGILS